MKLEGRITEFKPARELGVAFGSPIVDAHKFFGMKIEPAVITIEVKPPLQSTVSDMNHELLSLFETACLVEVEMESMEEQMEEA